MKQPVLFIDCSAAASRKRKFKLSNLVQCESTVYLRERDAGIHGKLAGCICTSEFVLVDIAKVRKWRCDT